MSKQNASIKYVLKIFQQNCGEIATNSLGLEMVLFAITYENTLKAAYKNLRMFGNTS